MPESPNLTDQLHRYAKRAAAEVEPVTTDSILAAPEATTADDSSAAATGSTTISSSTTEAPVLDLETAGSRRNPPTRVLVAVAACLALVALVAGVLAIVDEGPTRTTTAGPADDDNVTAGSNVLGYGAGWHDLDTGPLSARGGASLTWTGTELIVLAGERHHDGAAYDPATRTWRTIADPPWTDAGVVQAAWAGDRLYVLGPDTQATTSPCCQPRRWAVYDPATDEWTERESWTFQDPRDAAQVLIQPPPTLAWTGTQVLRLDTLDVYDPASDDWLPMPEPPEGAPIATAGWTGTEVVLAASDTPTQTYTPATRTWRTGGPLPLDGFVAHAAATAWDGDTLVFADSLGQAASLDPATGAWSELPSPRANFEACAPTGVMVDRPVFDLCDGLYRLTESGRWERIEGGEGTCCYPTIASTGDALFQWTSNDDTANNAAAPYTRFRLWIPPGTATVEAPTVTGPDDLEPTGTTGPSPTTGLPTPGLLPGSTDPATPSNPADPTMTMPPTTFTTLPPTSAPPSSTDTASFPWEWYDLPIDEATAKAEAEGRAWRIAREDDTEFDLTDDLVEGRVTFEVEDGRVTWAEVQGSISEGARHPDDRAFLGLDEDTMIARAEAEGWTVRVVARDGMALAATDDLRSDRLNISVVIGTVTSVGRY